MSAHPPRLRTATATLALAALALAAGCSDESTKASAEPDPTDAGADTGAAACEPWPFDGLEPACAFDPGPDPERSAPPPSALPPPTGPCPGFVEGDGCRADGDALTCTFQPEGEPERLATIWMSPDVRTKSGPLVFYYFGLYGFPRNAVTAAAGYPPEALTKLYDAGGLLVAPFARSDRASPTFSRLPWIGATGFEDDDGDYKLVDEVVGCANAELGIDVSRIHVSGLSAGAWMTSSVAVHRSAYVASVAMFSGGIEALHDLQDPSNKFPVAMFNGGPTDFVGAHFDNESQSGVNAWRHEGHFAMICEHGGGHTVPALAGIAGMQFLLDHPYGAVSSPYCQSTPAEADWCALQAPAENGVAVDTARTLTEIDTCTTRAGEAGIGGVLADPLTLDCACTACGSAFEACLDDAACQSVLGCAAEYGCLGVSCYQEQLCAAHIDAAGGPLGASAQQAIALADCLGAAACNPCEIPAR